MDAVERTPNTYDDPDSRQVLIDHISSKRNLGTVLIAREAQRRGAEVTWIDRDFAVAATGGTRVLLYQNRSHELSSAMAIADDKIVTKRLLENHAVPTPAGRAVASPADAVVAASELGGPVVVKPAVGLKGKGITVGAADAGTIERAYTRAHRITARVLVEAQVEGEEYRCLVTPSACISVVARIPPSVTGDGMSTIAALIEQKNELRKRNPHLYRRPIKINATTREFLGRGGWSISDVPGAGELVSVSNVANFSNGGESDETSNDVSALVKKVASAACAAIPGLPWAGVDVIAPADGTGPYVLEVNSSAVIASHQFPLYGTGRDAAGAIWEVKWEGAAQSAEMRQLDASAEPPMPADESSEGAQPSAQHVRLSQLMESVLAEQGVNITTIGETLIKAEEPGGRVRWLHKGRPADDTAVAFSACRRHGVVRRLLRLARVPRPAAQRVRSVEALASFAANAPHGVDLIGYARAWQGPRHRYVQRDDVASTNVSANERSLIAQRHLAGARFLVLASEVQALAVLTTEPSVDLADVMRASDTAVGAVQAVPGLAWAAIDVVVGARDRSSRAVVEGIALDPVVGQDHAVVAGSMKAAAAGFLPAIQERPAN